MTQLSICFLLKTATKHRIIEVEQNNYNAPFSFSEILFFLAEVSVYINEPLRQSLVYNASP